jgi:dTDP-4-dehydrorhamnose reductase
MRILLIGKSGQIGWELERSLLALGPIVALGREEFDLTNPSSIQRIVSEIQPEIMVNAAAYTAVDRAEDERELAYTTNAKAPGLLAEEARKTGALLVHYSTDYVFDGTKRSPYTESDPTSPLNVYGESKLAGEQAIQDSGAAHLIFRTSWVYSTRGKNFLLTILRLAKEREELRIVDDQIGIPNSAGAIAKATCAVLKQLVDVSPGKISGIYHMSGVGAGISWFKFASAILDEARNLASCPDKMPRVTPIKTQEYPTRAHRPAYSVLNSEKLDATFGVRLPDWKTQLKRVLRSEPN